MPQSFKKHGYGILLHRSGALNRSLDLNDSIPSHATKFSGILDWESWIWNSSLNYEQSRIFGIFT